jgi:formylmethanofuran dehydrogenase subunit E
MGLAGLEALGVEVPISKPTALIIVETDGCFVDGIEVATGATVGHRTLRINDLGKIAATFVDVHNARAIRLTTRHDARLRAPLHARDGADRYAAQLKGYRVMPVSELLRFQAVDLQPSLAALLSRPDFRVNCDVCGEEIINERQQIVGGATLCQACAGNGYYCESPRPLGAPCVKSDDLTSTRGEQHESTAEIISTIR